MRSRLLLACLLPFVLAACTPYASAVIYHGTYKREEIQKLADRGDPYAMMVLAEFHFRGVEGPTNRAEAARLYAVSAKKGNILAQERLDAMQRGEVDVGLVQDIWRRWQYSYRPSEAPQID